MKILRTSYLFAVNFIGLHLGAAAMLVTRVALLGGGRRICSDRIAPLLSRLMLRVMGLRLELHSDRPWPKPQTIYTANHTSLLDLYILCALGLPDIRFFMIRGCWRIPPLFVVAVCLGTFLTPPQERRDLRIRCFQRADRILRATGASVYLTPEGQRNPGGIGPFNKGALHLATSLKAPIVPLYIAMAPETEAGFNFFCRPGPIDVFVLPEVDTSDWTLDQLEANRDRLRAAYLSFEKTLRLEPTRGVENPTPGWQPSWELGTRKSEVKESGVGS